MSKKYKDILVGILIGGLIFTLTPVFAQNTIQAILSNYTIKINGQTVNPPNPPLIYQGQTYVPLRFIAESLNKEVAFDNGIIDINDKLQLDDNWYIGTSPPVVETPPSTTPKGTRVIMDGEEFYMRNTNVPEGAVINTIRWIGLEYNGDLYLNRNTLDNLFIAIDVYSDHSKFRNKSINSNNESITYTNEFLKQPENSILHDNSRYYNLKLFKDIVLPEHYNTLLQEVEQNRL